MKISLTGAAIVFLSMGVGGWFAAGGGTAVGALVVAGYVSLAVWFLCGLGSVALALYQRSRDGTNSDAVSATLTLLGIVPPVAISLAIVVVLLRAAFLR